MVLSLETSASAASVAITNGSRLVAQYFQNSGLTHSRTILKMTEDILRNSAMALADMEYIAVAHGPGSFTGIRIGVASAQGLCWGSEKPVRGVSTLLAMVSPFEREDAILCPVMDARRGEFYNALFRRAGGELHRLCNDRAVSIDALARECAESAEPFLLVGDGAEKCRELLTAMGLRPLLPPEHERFQTAYGVALAALDTSNISPQELAPSYLRASQAERQRTPNG
jgi:tRNA threonylcarbamoyladenosine biosynthesis protein TsaB